jgi:hypothetical protein
LNIPNPLALSIYTVTINYAAQGNYAAAPQAGPYIVGFL